MDIKWINDFLDSKLHGTDNSLKMIEQPETMTKVLVLKSHFQGKEYVNTAVISDLMLRNAQDVSHVIQYSVERLIYELNKKFAEDFKVS